MRRILATMVLLCAVIPLAPNRADSGACHPLREEAKTPLDYPAHPWSPLQSLARADTVFLAEVMVPTRKCSLGFCAGVRTVKVVKGDPGKSSLLQVMPPQSDASPCGPSLFMDKGSRWLVFADVGTSKTGYRYLQTAEEGPTYEAKEVPDFGQLEGHYQALRSQLDEAITARLGRLR